MKDEPITSGRKRLNRHIEEFGMDLERAIDISLADNKFEIAYLADEISKLKAEVARIKKKTRKVIDDE